MILATSGFCKHVVDAEVDEDLAMMFDIAIDKGFGYDLRHRRFHGSM